MTTSPRRSPDAVAAAARPVRRRAPRTERPQAPAAPVLAEDVAACIAAYCPRGGRPLARWPQTADLVRTAVAAAAPVSTAVTCQLLGAVSALAAWRADAGHSLEVAALFSDRSIDEFVAAQPHQRNARTTRSRLIRVARANGVPDATARALPPLSRTPVANPYTPSELASLVAWCAGHSTHGSFVLAAIALGVGAGLDGREQHQVTGRDVLVGPGALFVRAPGVRQAGGARSARPPRLVPVAAGWEDRLARLAVLAGDRPLIGATAARHRDFGTLNTLVDTGVPRLVSGRLRATWLADRVHDRVPLAALSRAGAGDVDRLLFRLADAVTVDVFVATLRGTACCPDCRGAAPFDPTRLPGLAVLDAAELAVQVEGPR